MANDMQREDSVPESVEKSDIALLIGALAAVAVLFLILAFARGEQAATLGIIWGWIVNLSIWIYLIVSAI